MSDEKDDQALEVLDSISDAITDVVSGLPAPIRRNAIKAFNRLCTAAIDVPANYLEGIAAEVKAASDARVRLIRVTAEQIAAELNVDPQHAVTAATKFTRKILGKQRNVNEVAKIALAHMPQETERASVQESSGDEPSAAGKPEISDDWLNKFEAEAELASSDDLRLIFGKILAGEIQRPNSFSVRTLQLLSQLDEQAAKSFQRLCSLSVSIRLPAHTGVLLDARVASLGGNASTNALQKYGLSFDQLNVLNEYGLIISDYNSWRGYSSAVVNDGGISGLPITHQNAVWVLMPEEGYEAGEVKLNGVAFSRAGRELLTVVDLPECDEYTAALTKFFAKTKLKFVRAHVKEAKPAAI